MSTRLRFIVVALGLLVFMAWASALVLRRRMMGGLEVRQYETRAAAQSGRAFIDGRLPRFLPPSARGVRAVYDGASNRRWMRFDADSGDLVSLVASLDTISADEARRTGSTRPRFAGPDWPQELSMAPAAPDRDAHELGFYRGGTGWCVAIEWSTGRAWGWTCDAAG